MSQPFDYLVMLDFEATCEADGMPDPAEIIEFPSVLYSTTRNEVIDEFESFVRPVHHPRLSDFCTDLTGIRQDQVDTAATFASVLDAHLRWLDGHDLMVDIDAGSFAFVTCGDWDLRTMFPEQIRHSPTVGWIPTPYRRWINIKRYVAELFDADAAKGLPEMLAAFGLEFVGRHHRGIDDSRNIATVVHHVIAAGKELDITGELSIRRHPPLEIRFECPHLGIEPVDTIVHRRSVSAVEAVAGATIDQLEGAVELSFEDGTPATTAALLDVRSRVTLVVTPRGNRGESQLERS